MIVRGKKTRYLCTRFVHGGLKASSPQAQPKLSGENLRDNQIEAAANMPVDSYTYASLLQNTKSLQRGALPTMLSMGLNASFPYRSMGQGLFDYTPRTSWFGGVTFWSIIKYDRIIASPRGIYKAMDCWSLLLGPGHFAYVLIAHNILIGHILGVLLTMLSMDYGLFSKVFGSLVLWPDDISQLMLSFPLMAVYLSSSKA